MTHDATPGPTIEEHHETYYAIARLMHEPNELEVGPCSDAMTLRAIATLRSAQLENGEPFWNCCTRLLVRILARAHWFEYWSEPVALVSGASLAGLLSELDELVERRMSFWFDRVESVPLEQGEALACIAARITLERASELLEGLGCDCV